MFAIATMTPKRTLELPPDIAQHFQPADRFIVWQEGDTVHFKRIEAVSPMQAVEDSPDDVPMTLDEIDVIVHATRQRRMHKAAEQ